MVKKGLLFFLMVVTLHAQSDIKQKVQNILDKIPNSTTAAVQITDPETGEILFEQNSTKIMIPASNTKLFTTAVALTSMGVNYEFTTKLFTDDTDFKDGIINGNLYVKGFGNSMFTDSDLDVFVKALTDSKINTIKGNIIGDDSYLDDIYYRDDWITDETANVPLPAVSALVLNRNMISVTVSAGSKSGRLVDVSVSPKNDYVVIRNSCKVTTRRRKPSVRLRFEDGQYIVEVSGSLRRNNSTNYSLKVDNPPYYMASALYSKIKESGINIIGEPQKGVMPSNTNYISTVSYPILDLVSRINKRSDNYLAECLFKTLGAFKSLKQGNSFYAGQAVNEFIYEHEIYDEGVAVVDGSGISRSNEVTVKSLSDLLIEMYKKPEYYEIYKKSLSEAGVEGTLRRRMKNDFNHTFWGKTGTLNGISSVSGYLEGKNNKCYVISMIFDFSKKDHAYYKNIQDEIIELLD